MKSNQPFLRIRFPQVRREITLFIHEFWPQLKAPTDEQLNNEICNRYYLLKQRYLDVAPGQEEGVPIITVLDPVFGSAIDSD